MEENCQDDPMVDELQLGIRRVKVRWLQEEIRLSPAQREWLADEIMWGTYSHEEHYRPLWDQADQGQVITREVFVPLWDLMDSVIDRVNHGDRDKAAYRDRGFAKRVLKKLKYERL